MPDIMRIIGNKLTEIIVLLTLERESMTYYEGGIEKGSKEEG